MSGKSILITGAGSGIGRAVAEEVASAGGRAVLLGRTRSALEDVLKKIGGPARGHLLLVADVSDEASLQYAFSVMAESVPCLHGVVANAGINGVWAPLDRLSVEEWDTTLAVNLRGTFLTVRMALPFLKPGGGSVVVVSSINGNRIFSNSGATAYACSKAAQVAFAKMTALEFARDRIRVNVVCPGAIRTGIEDSMETRDIGALHLPVLFPEGDVPLTGGSPGEPGDVAGTIGFLLSDAASHVTGTELYVDGGQSLLQG